MLERKTNLRALRLRHDIPLSELSAASGLSNQYISRAELGLIPATPRLEQQLLSAVETVIARRSGTAQAMEEELQSLRGRLLETPEVTKRE